MAVLAGLALVIWIALGYGAAGPHLPNLWWNKAVYALLAAGGRAGFAAIAWGFPPASPEPTRASAGWKGWLAGTSAGALLALLLWLAGADWLSAGAKMPWPEVLLLGIAVPALEELLYRDGLQKHLAGHMGNPAAIALSAAVFGLVHSWPAGIYVALCGLGFGVLYWRFGLISAILAHAVYNLILLSIPWFLH